MNLLDFAEKGARKVGSEFTDPDDDWMPVLFIRDGNGEIKIAGVPIPDDHDLAAMMVGSACAMMGAVEAVLLTSAWMATFEDGYNPDLPPSMQEKRKEVLVLTYVGKGTVCRSMPIIRSKKPPTLGPAEDMDRFDGRFDGRFVAAMRQGIK